MTNQEKPKTTDIIAGLPHDQDGYVGDSALTLDFTGIGARVSFTGESMTHPETVSRLSSISMDVVHDDKLSLRVGTTREGDKVGVLVHSDKPEQPVSADIRVNTD